LKDPRAEQSGQEKKPAAPKAGLATAARMGDMTALRAHLDAGANTETRLQGYTPLHLALLYGRAEAALELIARGADIHACDPQGEDPLLLTAMSNSINDADAARVAKALLERGASVYGPQGAEANPEHGEYTPLYLARSRKKTRLAAVLEEFGAAR
jgi:ankyrin repeat protein